jgi:3-keto-disaccharide hydrolase
MTGFSRLPLVALMLCAAPFGFSEGEWQPLFDGKTLDGWRETQFTRHGTVRVENGTITLGRGAMTGITRTKPFPKVNYEVRLEAARLDGLDFFAGITFPVKDSYCSWIIGGWGGSVVGLSSIDGDDASENETSTSRQFEQGRWYSLALRVTDGWIQAWIDNEKVIEVATTGRRIDLRPGEIDLSVPFGIASYSTVSGLRKLEYRELPAGQEK